MSTQPTVDVDIEPAHVRVDSERWDDIYIIGDVHGCREALEELLATVDPTTEDLVLFVGDLVLKGPDSKGVLEIVRERSNFHSVRGNNEQHLLDRRKSLDSLSPRNVEYIESTPAMLSWDGAAVVHGGVDHRKPMNEHTLTELLHMRSLHPEGEYDRPYWFEERQQPPRVFFGHTVFARPFVSDYAVGLDTGCVHGGQLTAYSYRSEELLTVMSPETYVPRASDRIVEPNPASSTE